MTTANDVIEEVIRLTLGGVNEEANKLSSPVSAGATSLVFTYDLGAIGPGSIVTIGLEAYRVWTVNTGTKTAVVEPGYQGTVTAAHAAGSIAVVNPRIPRFAAFKALNDELADLSSPYNGLYRMRTLELTPDSDLQYDLTGVSDLISVYDVVQEQPAFNEWRRVPLWTVAGGQNTTDFPSGQALRMPYLSMVGTVRVIYKAKFSPVVNLTDDLDSVAGLPKEMHDIPTYGILMRLGPTREISRNFTDTQPGRRADEVPAGSVANSYRSVMAQRSQRIQAEAARLMRLFPQRQPAS